MLYYYYSNQKVSFIERMIEMKIINIRELSKKNKEKKEVNKVNNFLMEEGLYEVEIKKAKFSIVEIGRDKGRIRIDIGFQVREDVEQKFKKYFKWKEIIISDGEEIEDKDVKRLETGLNFLMNVIKYTDYDIEELNLNEFIEEIIGKKFCIRIVKNIVTRKNESGEYIDVVENGVTKFENKVIWIYEEGYSKKNIKTGEVNNSGENKRVVETNEEIGKNDEQNEENTKNDEINEKIESNNEVVENEIIEKNDEVKNTTSDFSKYLSELN